MTVDNGKVRVMTSITAVIDAMMQAGADMNIIRDAVAAIESQEIEERELKREKDRIRQKAHREKRTYSRNGSANVIRYH